MWLNSVCLFLHLLSSCYRKHDRLVHGGRSSCATPRRLKAARLPDLGEQMQRIEGAENKFPHTQEVDHLGDAKQRSNDQGSTAVINEAMAEAQWCVSELTSVVLKAAVPDGEQEDAIKAAPHSPGMYLPRIQPASL
ncbi:hypothetical protein EYF80_002765 [Liparis tanakae]|uniref:Uncharacterized protein n=1 Tax=Liparis tanakae TaxID=230148 RepID=A0A4Z2JA72_9TELE|nr:hypothetical protein EYF80_002765 [Liparis tanakae]